MSLMSGLYVGAGGLQTASNALNTVAHNLSNVDTEGYTRQQVSLSTRRYEILSKSGSAISYQEVGLGVRYSEVRQIRDSFLDKTYRRESGRSAFYEVSYNTLAQVQDLLGESGDHNFQEAITDFWKTVQELADDPSSAVTQGLLVSKAATLIERSSNVYNSLCDYQNNLNGQVKTIVDQVNSYGERLKELNDEIAKIETAGVEHANDLRDERNYILDELGKLANITYSEDIDSYVSVKLEGQDLVKRDTFFKMGYQSNADGFYDVFWVDNAKTYLNDAGEKVYIPSTAPVFDMTREISSDINTDIGKLKAVLLARGDHNATSADMEDEKYYNDNISQSICMNIEAEFDRLINSIVQSVNGILTDAGYTDENGDALFVRNVVPDDPAAADQLWHVGNILINDRYLQQPTLLKMKKVDGSVDYDTAEKLKDAFSEDKYKLNPNATKATNFVEYYSDLLTQVSNSGQVYESIYNNQQVTVSETEKARDQIVGVSTDEELQFMIMFQNAYNASSRYINTVNEMLENMLNSFGA